MLIVVLAKLFIPSVSFPQLRTFYGSNFTVSSSHSDLNCTDLNAYAHSNLESSEAYIRAQQLRPPLLEHLAAERALIHRQHLTRQTLEGSL
jgi:hypothetical protein